MSNIKEQTINKLKTELKTKSIGQVIKYYPTISSTNEEARRVAELGAIEGTVVFADMQSGGRGRRNRVWESPVGGIWLTIILRPKIAPVHAPIITLLTGIAGVNTISKTTNLNSTLKWPNDIRINGKKVCGILTELTAEHDKVSYILVGLGFNVNNKISDFTKDLRSKVTTLSKELKYMVDRNQFIRQFFEEFENLYFKFIQDPERIIPKILKTWCQASDTIGRTVRVETINETIIGLAARLDRDGALIIKTINSKENRIIAGDCIYLEQ